jgi:hypothetical protein
MVIKLSPSPWCCMNSTGLCQPAACRRSYTSRYSSLTRIDSPSLSLISVDIPSLSSRTAGRATLALTGPAYCENAGVSRWLALERS